MPLTPTRPSGLASATRRWARVLAFAASCAPVAVGAQLHPDSSRFTPEELEQAFFYRGRPYGIDAYMGPVDVILNKGYAVAQFNNRNRHIFDYPYASSHVWNSITKVGANVERYGGWRKFIGDEVFPTSLSWRSWKWAPNYFGHLIEGGMTFRRLSEWNRAHGVPAPGLSAAVVTMGAAVINEMYAHPGFIEGTAATGADLLFFDPLGILVFSIDDVSRFFGRTLKGNIWASQAALTPDGELVNNGNNFVVKIPLPRTSEWSLFARGGLAFTPGVTFHRSDGLDVSVAFGGEGRIQNLDPETGEETPEIALGGGVFFDRDGTLLASVMASEAEHRRFVVNVYPGLLDVWDGRLGGWIIVRERWHVRLGISIGGALGIGPALGFGGGR